MRKPTLADYARRLVKAVVSIVTGRDTPDEVEAYRKSHKGK